jgi:hypothetical protein
MNKQHVIGKVESLPCSGSHTTTLNLELLDIVFFLQGKWVRYSHEHLLIHVQNFESKVYTVTDNNSLNINKTNATFRLKSLNTE